MEYFPKLEEKFLISVWPCNILCKYNIVTVVIIIVIIIIIIVLGLKMSWYLMRQTGPRLVSSSHMVSQGDLYRLHTEGFYLGTS